MKTYNFDQHFYFDGNKYKLNSNCLLISGKVPSEIFNMFRNNFNKSIGISSSATKSVRADVYIDEEVK